MDAEPPKTTSYFVRCVAHFCPERLKCSLFVIVLTLSLLMLGACAPSFVACPVSRYAVLVSPLLDLFHHQVFVGTYMFARVWLEPG